MSQYLNIDRIAAELAQEWQLNHGNRVIPCRHSDGWNFVPNLDPDGRNLSAFFTLEGVRLQSRPA
jgi:hypothetical protein